MSATQAERAIEQQKYAQCYNDPDYRMGDERLSDAEINLKFLSRNFKELHRVKAKHTRLSLLDVGCGRGELVRKAVSQGFWPVRGLECVQGLCGGIVEPGEITKIPYEDERWDVVTCFDVIEHLPPADTELALRELYRVASQIVIVAISNVPSHHKQAGELHINRRPYAEWDALLKEIWSPASVNKVSRTRISETWRCLKSGNSTSA